MLLSRTWGTGVLCAASLLLPSCGGGGTSTPTETIDFQFPDATCDAVAPRDYLLGVTSGFTLAQLIELVYPSATYVAVLHVGESVTMKVTAHTLGSYDCGDRITAVKWETSDSQVAAAQGTGRSTALLTGLTPGEVTVHAEAAFGEVPVDVPYMFSSGPDAIRAVRVVP